MMKYRVVCWFVAVAALICLATAQNSQGRSSSAKPGPDKPGPDPLHAATKPLTPKSAMPPQRKSSVAEPKAGTSGKTNAELTRLERQNRKAGGSKSGSAAPAKGSSSPKSADASAASGSGINFKYKKPVGGMTASTPGANAKNSSTPRVKKD